MKLKTSKLLTNTLLGISLTFLSLTSCVNTKKDESVTFRCSGGWYIPPAFHGNSMAQGGDGSHIHFIYDTLFFYVPKTNQMIPRIGLEVSEGEDDKSLTFKIRKGVLWHDGSPFNAYDIKNNFLILYLQGWGGNLKSIDVIDDYTIKFNWLNPMNIIEKRNLMLEKIRCPKHIYKKWADQSEKILAKVKQINDIKFENWTDKEKNINSQISIEKSDILQDMYKYRPETPIGTGAFKLNHVSASELELIKFDKAWNKDQVSVDKIKMLKGPSNDIIWAYLIAGDVDVAHPATPQDVTNQILKLNKRTKVIVTSDYGDFGFLFNTKRMPMSDLNFRKAIAHLTNKDMIRMVSSYYSKTSDNKNIPIIGSLKDKWITKSFNDSLIDYDYSPKKAIEILENAGYKKDANGFYTNPDGTEIKLEIASIAGYSDWVLASESFATQLTNAGIRANVRTLEGSFFNQQLQNNEYDIASNFGSDFKMYAHPIVSFGRFFDPNGYIKKASFMPDVIKDKNNNNVVIQKEFDKVVNTRSESERLKSIEKLSEITNMYLPFLSIYEKNLTVFAVDGERVSGWADEKDPIWSSSALGLETLYSYLISSGKVHKVNNEIK